MKLCFKCHREKPLDEFYRHPMMGDGRLGKCKECAKADVRANRRARLSYYRQYDRKRLVETTVRQEQRRRQSESWRERQPAGRIAQGRVQRAVRAGLLKKQPCRDCGSPNVHGHHPDYSRPLEVIWLCPEHHVAEHQRMRRAS